MEPRDPPPRAAARARPWSHRPPAMGEMCWGRGRRERDPSGKREGDEREIRLGKGRGTRERYAFRGRDESCVWGERDRTEASGEGEMHRGGMLQEEKRKKKVKIMQMRLTGPPVTEE
jgi:hypothetical protein